MSSPLVRKESAANAARLYRIAPLLARPNRREREFGRTIEKATGCARSLDLTQQAKCRRHVSAGRRWQDTRRGVERVSNKWWFGRSGKSGKIGRFGRFCLRARVCGVTRLTSAGACLRHFACCVRSRDQAYPVDCRRSPQERARGRLVNGKRRPLFGLCDFEPKSRSYEGNRGQTARSRTNRTSPCPS